MHVPVDLCTIMYMYFTLNNFTWIDISIRHSHVQCMYMYIRDNMLSFNILLLIDQTMPYMYMNCTFSIINDSSFPHTFKHTFQNTHYLVHIPFWSMILFLSSRKAFFSSLIIFSTGLLSGFCVTGSFSTTNGFGWTWSWEFRVV